MKQALITGGARGIGFGIAEAMLEAGYGVTVTGLTDEEVAAVPPRENLEGGAAGRDQRRRCGGLHRAG